MSNVPPVSTGGSTSAVDKMTEAFDIAISKSAEVTIITTLKKAELEAAKQRPN